MYISTEIQSFKKYGDNRKVLTLLKNAGFTAYDFSIFRTGNAYLEFMQADDYLAQAQKFRAFADGLGLPCNQTHAPFPTAIKGNDEYNEKTFHEIVRAIEVSGILGAKICVVHPCNDYTAEENAELYKKFEPYARKAGVKIALENMWNSYHWGQPDFHALPASCSHHDDFFKHMELLPKDIFCACVDIGHAEMAGLDTSAEQMIERLGGYMQCMHLQDIDGINDNHQVPFNYSVDFEKVITALKNIGYQGDITLECAYTATKHPVELYESLARYMASVADYFRKRLEE